MRTWFVWGMVVWCAVSASRSWGQQCTTAADVERAVLDLQISRHRLGPGLRALDGGPDGRAFDIGEIAVLEDDGAGGLIYQTKQGDNTVDIPAITQKYYRTHRDDADFLVVFTSFPIVDPVSEAPFSAYSIVVNNDVTGLHLPNMDYSADFGSAGNLEQVLNMNNYADARYQVGPYERMPGNHNSPLSLLAHETEHRWGARVQVNDGTKTQIHASDALLGRAYAHWSFFLNAPTLMGSSSLEGNLWQSNGDGTFSTVAESDGYSPLDQYLMGLRGPDEVSPFYVIDGPHAHSASDPPEEGVTEAGVPHWYTVRDIIAVEGRRLPGTRSAAGAWRQAFVLVVPKGYPDSHPDQLRSLVARMDGLRREWGSYFFASTQGRGRIYTELRNSTAPLYRLYFPSIGLHFYTADETEAYDAVAALGFTLEGATGELYMTQAAGTVPFYRLYHPLVGTHFYTTDPLERESLMAHAGYIPEGVVGYLYPTPTADTVPLYRLYRYEAGEHLFTTNADEVVSAQADGYVLEGIVGYVFPEAVGP